MGTIEQPEEDIGGAELYTPWKDVVMSCDFYSILKRELGMRRKEDERLTIAPSQSNAVEWNILACRWSSFREQ